MSPGPSPRRRPPGRPSSWVLVVLAVLSLLSSSSPAQESTTEEWTFAGFEPSTWTAPRPALARANATPAAWLTARSAGGHREMSFGDRVVLSLLPGQDLPRAELAALQLTPAREIQPGWWMLQAPDAWTAARAAASLSTHPGVTVATPISRPPLARRHTLAPLPPDPYVGQQWHLQNRTNSGARFGPDLNLRGAWSATRGEGVVVAVVDDGFEVQHPDLREAAQGLPHFDFVRGAAGATTYDRHATPVAGLVGARDDNSIGVVGAAPRARLLSLVIFDTLASGGGTTSEGLANMFQYRTDLVAVQNRSWGSDSVFQLAPTALEQVAISNAMRTARGGLGLIAVQAGGNTRDIGANANDDGYSSDPQVIAVASVRRDGRVASYSSPGASLLVAAPSGDTLNPDDPSPGLVSTDRVGIRGYNTTVTTTDAADYTTADFNGFSGTSAAAPQISGLAALILAARPAAGYRDVQQILLESATHFDLADPAMTTNGAGYRVSHNVGFGLPDAGRAVDLARDWSNRPAAVTASVTRVISQPIPADGLKLWVVSNGVQHPIQLQAAQGPQVETSTAALPLVFVGLATNTLTQDLRGKAALIERGVTFFREKIELAAAAGAAYAVIYNHLNGTELMIPGGTEFTTIPAVFITENDGRALVRALTNGVTQTAQVRRTTARQVFTVTNELSCEHVGLRIRTSQPRRADLRITLLSPAGTRSVLQARNDDPEAGPVNWTYWSTQHFREGSKGTWTVDVSSEADAATGSVLELELKVIGVAIRDADGDGLDDDWEQRWFTSFGVGPRDDPDHDGSTNAREQALGTSPIAADEPLRLEIARLAPGQLHLHWPASPAFRYDIEAIPDSGGEPEVVGAVEGTFPTAELVLPSTGVTNRLLRLRAVARE